VLTGGYIIDKREFERCVVCARLYCCKYRNERNDGGLADRIVIEASSKIITYKWEELKLEGGIKFDWYEDVAEATNKGLSIANAIIEL